MPVRNNLNTLLMTLGAAAALSACSSGADQVASPGIGAFPPAPVTSPPPAPGPAPSPGTGQPAADCPAGFANVGTIVDGSGATLRSCQLPPRLVSGFVVPAREGTIYSISGRTDVGDDQGGNINAPIGGREAGTLTIEAGVRLYGSGGLDFIVVNRGSRINVQGTPEAPVIMTSRQSIEGNTGVDSIGQWGGLVILGRAPIANCPSDQIASGSPDCVAQVEGTNAFYGGNAPGDNSGSIRYLRIQHSGFQILPNNELNGITLAGVGSSTVFEFVQVHNSSDDGIEWFGGTVNARNLVLTGNDDDSLDTDVGFTGAIQFAIVVQRAGGGDRMNEFSGLASSAAPLRVANPKLANVTFVGRAGGGVGIIMNTGTNAQYYNAVVTKAAGGTNAGAACLDVDDATTSGQFHSVYFSCPAAFFDNPDPTTGDPDTREAEVFNAPANTNTTANGTSTLTATFINGANETAVTAFPTLTAVSSFFTQVSYIGAVRDASDTWWQGWTCGLTADTPC